MAVENEVQKDEQSYLSMSDEDIGKVDIGALSLQAQEAPVNADDDEPVDDVDEKEPQKEKEEIPEVVPETVEDKEPTDPVIKDADIDNEVDKDKTDPVIEPVVDIDYKAEYEKLIAPFKANGRDMTVTNAEDARALMQMGANYNKKMAALKPNLKMMKLLENNGLLDEAKLSYLIDLDKKDPAAITRLIKESGIDPLDLPTDSKDEYVPKKHTVDEVEMELDAVLDELQDTPTYSRTLNVVSQQWDASSKQTIANAPQILKVINDHMQSGIYDQVHAEMESERMFGRLKGLSDIEAYRQVGDAIQARGGFDHLGHQGQQATKPVIVTPKPKVADNDKLKDKRRAASSTKPAVSSGVAEFNPLALSDEEFSKQVNGKYL